MPFHGGSFLIAKPKLLDPNFRQTVVLLVQHNEEGAFGLVVNRPVPVKDFPCPVFAGGPCEPQRLFLLHGHADWVESEDDFGDEKSTTEIAQGIFMGDGSCTEKIEQLEGEEAQVRMFAGYAGWGPGQLEAELAEGAWDLSDADGQTLFQVPPLKLWQHLKPPSIPEPSMN